MKTPEFVDPYQLHEGIWRGPRPVIHREEDYHSNFFPILAEMEQRHFWYRGRYRFLLWSVKKYLRIVSGSPLRIIDLGGGCGGWIRRLAEAISDRQMELAVGDSSLRALELARLQAPPEVRLYHVDCMDLGWQNRWDAIFLLDVLEHLPDDLAALEQIRQALRPGGLLWITVPALQQFWSYNDELAQHRRRYNRADFARLAELAELTLLDARYFMFLLSPLVWVSRLLIRPRRGILSATKAAELLQQTHRIPHPVLNTTLTAIAAAETPLGHWIRFPWGTSLLGIFQKPLDERMR